MSDDLREFLTRARGGAAAAARVIDLESRGKWLGRLDDLHRHVVNDQATAWGLEAFRGRLIELSARGATATLTTSIELVLEAQRASEPVAWIMASTGSTFYPPDVADSGVDLSALVVIRAPDRVIAARAAERLLRSGAFGLVVLDFVDFSNGASERLLPDHVLGRLVTLAQAHDAAVVCISEKPQDASSLGSLVSLRAEALRARDRDGRGGFEVRMRALKDKRRGPGWTRAIKARGPAGM
ncbi:MAG: recombinase A [Kofleriaceae bacterium]